MTHTGMMGWNDWAMRLRALFSRRRAESELDEELKLPSGDGGGEEPGARVGRGGGRPEGAAGVRRGGAPSAKSAAMRAG
jgi:hypothetical protein